MSTSDNLSVKLTISADGRAAVTELNGLDQSVRRLGETVEDAQRRTAELANRIFTWGAGLVAFDTLANSVGRFVDTLGTIQGEAQSFQAITGSAELSARELERTSAWADRLGVEIGLLRGQYAQLMGATKGTALEGAATANIFDAVAEAAARLNVGTEKTKSALLAVGQIAGKGVVSMDDLRQQLAEAIPGATVAMAKGLGISVDQLNALVETGTLAADKALPALAKGLRESFGLDQSQRIEGLRAEVGRLQTALRGLTEDAGKGGLESLLTQLAKLGTVLADNVSGASLFRGGVALAFSAAVGAAASYASAILRTREAQALAAREAQAAAAQGLSEAQSTELRARAHVQLTAAASAEARAYGQLVAATTAASVETQAAAAAELERSRATVAGAAATKAAADAELLRLGSIEGVQLAAADSAAFEVRLAAARETTAAATTSLQIAERQLALDTERAAAADKLATDSAAQLAVASETVGKARTARIAAEAELSAAVRGTAEADALAATAGQKLATSWKGVATASGAISAATSGWLGFEVGNALQSWVGSTDLYRAALLGLGTELGKELELERQTAERRAAAAPMLKKITEQTGVTVESLDDLNAAVERGALVWDSQTKQWVKGVGVTTELKRGILDLDSQVQALLKHLDAQAQAQAEIARTEAQTAETADSLARLVGDESAALRILADARVKAVSAAREQLAFNQAELAASRQALAEKLKEAAEQKGLNAAGQERVRILTEQVAAQQRAVAAGTAAVAAAEAEAQASRIAALAYGDQSAKASQLVAERERLAASLATLEREKASGAQASYALADAEAKLSTTQKLLLIQMTLGKGNIDVMARAYRDQKLQVDLLKDSIAKGQSAEKAIAGVRTELRTATALAADAVRDLVEARQQELTAAERSVQKLRAEGDARAEHLRNLAEEAQARGDTAAAAELETRASEVSVATHRKVASSLQGVVLAAEALAAAVRQEAEADGIVDQAEKERIATAEEDVRVKKEQAKAAQEAARHEAAMAEAATVAAAGAEKQAAATEDTTRAVGQLAPITRTWSELMAEAGVNLSALGDYADVAQEAFGRVYTQQSKLSDGSISFEGYADGLRQAAAAAATAAESAAANARAADALARTMDDLGGQYDRGTLGLAAYIARLEGVRAKFSSLGDDAIRGVTDELRSARAEMESFAASAEDGLRSLKQEWADLNGQQEQSLAIEEQGKRIKLEEQLTQARRDGNTEAATALQQQLSLLDKIYSRKRADAAQSAAEARQAQTAAAQQKTETAAASEQRSVATQPARTVRVEIASGGKTTPIDVKAGQETDFLDAIKRSGLVASARG